jgi:glutamine amidotransferase
MIGIINYGSGNLSAFINVYKSLNKKILIIENPEELDQCSHIIMPGVSAWDTTMSTIGRFKDALSDYVLNKKIPFLGVCVGMQILAMDSEEGTYTGLDLVAGNVRKLPFRVDILEKEYHLGPILPHMGWNNIEIKRDVPLLSGLGEKPEFYFLHSYYFDATNQESIISTASYNRFEFPVIIQNENVFGVQFHPEKSHTNGKLILDNFSKL